MKIRDLIKVTFQKRLMQFPCLAVYDPDQRYREIVRGLAGSTVTVVEADQSTIRGRETAMQAWNELPGNGPSQKRLIVYLPLRKPQTREERMRDPYSFLWVGREEAHRDGVFPAVDGDDYQSLCRLAKPDYVGQINQLFANGVPDFDTVDSVDTGSNWPRLRSLLGVESGQEILTAIISPSAKQKKSLQNDDAWPTECRQFCQKVLGMTLNGRLTKWESISEDIATFILFSEFVLDLPNGDVPSQLASIPHAPAEARTIIYGVCDNLRNSHLHEARYIDLANMVTKSLHLEQHTAAIIDLGVRDTFSFEERTFLRRFNEAVAAGDYDTAELIADSRKASVWVRTEARQMEWTVAERGLAMLRKIEDLAPEVGTHSGSAPALIHFYIDRLREVDAMQRGFEQAVDDLYGELAALQELVAKTRKAYRHFVEIVHKSFICLVEQDGWPADGVTRQTQVFEKYVKPLLTERRRVALIMVDALRYELGGALHASLSGPFQVTLGAVCAQLPTATPVGMASLLPEADARLKIENRDGKMVPTLGGKAVVLPADRLAYVQTLYGDRVAMKDMTELILANDLNLPPTVQLLMVKTSDIDWMGESHPALAIRNLMPNLKDIMAAVRKLADGGFERVVITTDHGFVLLPDTQPGDSVTQPSGNWPFAKRRSLLGKGAGNKDVLVFDVAAVGICGDTENYAVPRTYATFASGVRYFHEGLSLQECILPVLCVDVEHKEEETSAMAPELTLSYRGGVKKVTTRRPFIQVELATGLFAEELRFVLQAVDDGGKVVGHAAASECVDAGTGMVRLAPGRPVKVPMRLDDDFEGNLQIQAIDPESSYVYDRLDLKTDYLE